MFHCICFYSSQLLGRTLRVDHVAEYRKPKEDDNTDEVTKKLHEEGCAPRTPSPSPPLDSDEDLAVSHKHKGETHWLNETAFLLLDLPKSV